MLVTWEPLLRLRRALLAEYVVLQRTLLRVVKGDQVCRRLMTIPGVGPVTALAFKTTIDHPQRFRRSADVAPSLGLVRGSSSRARRTKQAGSPRPATSSPGARATRPHTSCSAEGALVGPQGVGNALRKVAT
jgi:transposase